MTSAPPVPPLHLRKMTLVELGKLKLLKQLRETLASKKMIFNLSLYLETKLVCISILETCVLVMVSQQ